MCEEAELNIRARYDRDEWLGVKETSKDVVMARLTITEQGGQRLSDGAEGWCWICV